jgi:hypothetical protein
VRTMYGNAEWPQGPLEGAGQLLLGHGRHAAGLRQK